MEQPQPLFFIQQQCQTITERAKKLMNPNTRDLMEIGTAAEAVAHEVEQVLKWGVNGQP